jgi:L-alanine-DL-glutamate epimerase-like enolase superfamily enzyme
LASYDLHSIEQPIRQGQIKEMASLCRLSPLPIALDEELIGVNGIENKRKLLEAIMPQYIILKPSLVGGIASSREWIALAESLDIGWWMTSALESNIGLNAIAQLTSTFSVTTPQGLGTGQLYYQ